MQGGRLVAQEVNMGGEANAAFYAATPPLDAKKLISRTSPRDPNGRPTDEALIRGRH